MHYRPGIEIVPGYRLQKMLGRGGFGEVWQAEGPGRVSAAVKIIDKVEDKAGRKEFRALKLIKDLRHPNLVSITGFWLKDAEGSLLDSDAYIDESNSTEQRPSELIVAMDLCEKSLLDRLAECRKGLSEDTPGGIPLEELLEYMEAAAKAIDYLNVRHQIQHRDIKPHNIMIVGGSAQVCDFGLASAISTARTSMGGAGSLAYMAPEVYSTKLPGPATDQYSLAITYCELRTGRLPLSDVESFAALDDAKRKGMLDLSLLDERERAVIQRATSLDPAARFPSCYDMVQEFRRALHTAFSSSAPARAEPVAGYTLERSLRSRDGEEIWDAIDPDGLHVLLVVRNMHEAPATASWSTLSAIRDVSRNHPRLAEIYEFACLSATGKVLPARLFKLPNPPMPAKTIVAGRRLPQNLAERLSSGGMPIKRLLLLMGDLAEGLDFLNAPQHDVGGKLAGFQHANLRPINFLVDDDRTVLSNFAGAQMLLAEDEAFPGGKQIAESAFTPPEFAAGQITRWSDQYMLAVSYLQLRTGKPSASLSGSTGSGKRSASGSRLDVTELKPTERDILLRATDADPRKRFATCREFVAALGQAWDDIIAAEPPPPQSPKKKTSSADAAAATIDADSVVSASLSGLRDSAQTALEPTPPPPARGATLVPSAIETRPPHDTNPDHHTATPQRIADAPHAPPRPPKHAAKRAAKPRLPSKAVAAATKPWWRTRSAIVGGIAIALLAVAVPVIYSLIPGPEGHVTPPRQEKPMEDPTTALREEIQRLISAEKFADASVKLRENRATLADAASELTDELVGKWSESAAQKAKLGTEKSDARLLDEAVASAIALAEQFSQNAAGRQSLIAAAQMRIGLYKKQLAVAELSDAEAKVVAGGAERLIGGLAAVKPPDAALLASVQLVKARAARRASDLGKAKSSLLAIQPQQLADARDRAAWEALNVLMDEVGSNDLTKLKNVDAAYRSKLDPWERDQLLQRIAGIEGGKIARVKAEWAKQAGALRADIAVGGDSLVKAREALENLGTSAPEVLEYLNGANTPDYREFRGLRMLCTLRLDGLDLSDYVNALEELNERIRVDKTPLDALELCEAALDRALAIEAALSYDDPREVAEAHGRVESVESMVALAAQQFSEHSTAITALVADAQRRRVESTLTRLRKLRDDANDAAEFAALRKYAAGIADVVGPQGNAAVLRVACALECELQDGQQPSLADQEKLRSGLPQASDQDRHYIAFVAAIARPDTSIARLVESADAIQAAYAADGSNLTWRERSPRKMLAFELVKKAAAKQAQGERDKLATPYYTPGGEAAKKSAAWLATFSKMFPQDKPPLNDERFREFRYLQALAAFYSSPDDAETAKNVVAWTDPLVAGENKFDPPLQVVLVNALSHKVVGEATRSAIAFARLYDACRVAAKASAPKPHEIDKYVLAPAIELLESQTASLPDAQGKRAAARLFAARGRYAHLHPSVQSRVRAELDAAGNATSVAKKAFDWFDAAVKLDPTSAEYYYGRGYSCDLRTDLSYADRAARMKADAADALAPGRQPQSFPAARGLRGLSLLYESLTVADYDKRRELLVAADGEYTSAISACDALRKSGSTASYPEIDTDYPLLLVGRGTVLLQLANYESDPVNLEKLLQESLGLALSVTDDRSDSDVPTYTDGVHPEWAYRLAGNALEDFGWLLDKPEYYQLALVQFGKAAGAAAQLDDPAGASLSRYYRGRCRFKLAKADLAAAASLDNASQAAVVQDLRGRGERELKEAMGEISGYLENAAETDAEIAEARGFLAQIRLVYAVSGLWKSDEFDASMLSFDEAVKAAKRRAYSPLDWQTLVLQQADAAVEFVDVAADGREKAARYDKARQLAEDLAKDEQADGVMRSEANMKIAAILAKQAAAPGKFRDEILSAFEHAIALAAGSQETVAVARARRGEYVAQNALRVNPLGDAECNALAGGAEDYFAAVDKAAPLSLDRMQRAIDLSIIVGGMDTAKIAYARKAEYDKARPKYIAKIVDIAAQTAADYARRFTPPQQFAYAKRAGDLLKRAAALGKGDAKLSAKTKPFADAQKAIANIKQADPKVDAWWDPKSAVKPLLPPKK
ncbi:MAG: protein kinase [Pirellulales bacterium]